MHYTHPSYQTSIVGKNCAYYIRIFTVSGHPSLTYVANVVGEAARSMLGRMPARLEEELDAVTLHNQALFDVDQLPAAAVAKLQFLLRQDSFPAETFENLLLLYTKYEVIRHTCCGPFGVDFYT